MKYIRTEDGLHKVNDVYYDENIDMNRYDTTDGIFDSIEVEKDADTIEGLCDNCVVITEAYRKVSSFYDCEYEIEKYKKQTKTNNPIIAIYGAIWTDKGLIYVAKMNKSEVLELL